MTVTVRYWRGTIQLEEKVKTYREAMSIASQNQNAYGPSFFDENGVELHDDGQGLCYPDPEVEKTADGTVIERRLYAV